MTLIYTLAGFAIGAWLAKRSWNKSKRLNRGGVIRALATFLWSAMLTWLVLFGFFSTPQMKQEAEASRQQNLKERLAEQKAQPAQAPTTPAGISSNPTKAFTDCLAAKAPGGNYTSDDGGQSAIRLMGDCHDQWNAYVDACMAIGQSDGDCTLKSGVLAQAALKLVNK